MCPSVENLFKLAFPTAKYCPVMLRKMNCCQQLSEILKRLNMTQTIDVSVMEMDDGVVEKECDTEQRHDKTV